MTEKIFKKIVKSSVISNNYPSMKRTCVSVSNMFQFSMVKSGFFFKITIYADFFVKIFATCNLILILGFFQNLGYNLGFFSIQKFILERYFFFSYRHKCFKLFFRR